MVDPPSEPRAAQALRWAMVERVSAALEILVAQARAIAPERALGGAAVVAVIDRCRLTDDELRVVERFLRLRLDGRLRPSDP